MDKPRNYLIADVELNWVRVDNAISPFGTPQWEAQIATTDKAKADELAANHMKVKEKDGKFVVSLKRKAVKADGTPMDPVRVVDGNKAPITARSSIGNGSTGNVIVWQSPYDIQGRKGISNSLTAIQVTNLVEFVASGVDFDVVEGSSETPSADLF